MQAEKQVPTLTANNVTYKAATLILAYHSDNWYYKSTTPAGTCSAEIPAGTATASLTGLTASTTYTFKAYSDSGCSTEITSDTKDADFNSLAAPTFTASAAATSLKLTIANWSGDWYYKYTNPTSGSCSTTAIAAGLDSNTSYTFKAYSDSGCNTDLATAAATSTLVAATLSATDMPTTPRYPHHRQLFRQLVLQIHQRFMLHHRRLQRHRLRLRPGRQHQLYLQRLYR